MAVYKLLLLVVLSNHVHSLRASYLRYGRDLMLNFVQVHHLLLLVAQKGPRQRSPLVGGRLGKLMQLLDL